MTRKRVEDFIKVVKKSRAYVITEPTALPAGVEPQQCPTRYAEGFKQQKVKPKRNNNNSDFNRFGGGGSFI